MLIMEIHEGVFMDW